MKDAITSVPINDLARRRWSPRAFLNIPVEKEKIRAILEAARWSASAMNEQPWRFILGQKPDNTWQMIFDTLADGNQVWVKSVPVLLLVIGKTNFSNDQSPSTIYPYDTGQAVAHLSLEAAHQGLFVHQMGGFSAEKATRSFQIPEEYKPLTVVAIGNIGSPEILPENLKKRELSPRVRKPLEELVFHNKFGEHEGLVL